VLIQEFCVLNHSINITYVLADFV